MAKEIGTVSMDAELAPSCSRGDGSFAKGPHLVGGSACSVLLRGPHVWLCRCCPRM